MLRAQRGAGALFVVAVLLLAMVLIGAVLMLSRGTSNADAQLRTRARLDKLSAALEQYVMSTGRLPCPANAALGPGADSGVEAITGSSCTAGFAGTIPWKTIGMGRDDTFDAWGWRISYRVYSAPVGGFTQPTSGGSPVNGGASMVNCNSTPSYDLGVDGSGFCRSDYTTSADVASFTAGKGLTVKEYSDVSAGAGSTPIATYTGVAYALISHGPSGLGAYTSSGARKDLPASGPEHDNTDSASNTAPFPVSSIAPASSRDVASDATGHFDDIVVYRTFADLVRRTGLVARPWSFASMLQAAMGSASAPSAGSSLGTTNVDFGGAQFSSGSLSGPIGNLSYDIAGGTPGIGVFGGGSTSINGAEYITVTFAKTAGKVAISLGGFDRTESATLAFLSGGMLVGSPVTLKGCQNGDPSGGPVASFTVAPGFNFDEIGVTSWPYSSAFLLSAVKSCAATDASCVTSLDSAANHCS